MWPWQDRNQRFSWLKAGTFALMFVPAIWLIHQVATEQFGPVPLGGMTYWSGLFATGGLTRPRTNANDLASTRRERRSSSLIRSRSSADRPRSVSPLVQFPPLQNALRQINFSVGPAVRHRVLSP